MSAVAERLQVGRIQPQSIVPPVGNDVIHVPAVAAAAELARRTVYLSSLTERLLHQVGRAEIYPHSVIAAGARARALLSVVAAARTAIREFAAAARLRALASGAERQFTFRLASE